MAKLELLVDVNTRGARGLEGIGDKLGRVGRNMSVGVTLPLIAAGGAFAGMAAEAEEAQAKLESVFESTGAAAWTSIDALNEHAEALANATTFDDDAIKDAQAALLAFGEISGDQFTEATDAAADLAAFLGTDIEDAARQLGKTLADPEEGLGRLARSIGPLTEEQEKLIDSLIAVGDEAGAQQAILDIVSEKIGTVAEDLAATTSGQMQQAMNELGEAGESIGVFLLPALSTLAGLLETLAGWFQGLSPQMQGFVVNLGLMLAAVGPIALAISGLTTVFGLLAGAVALVLSPLGLLAVAVIGTAILIAAKWDELVNAVEAFGRMFAAIFTWIGERFADLGTWIGEVWDSIVDVFKGAVSAVADIGKKIWTPIADGFETAIDVIKGIWNAFARFWNSIEISVPSVDVPFVGKLGGFSIGVPDLPMLASGGIVTAPTLALIGERGPEAVIPLDQMAQGVTIEVNVLGDLKAEDEDSVAAAIGRVLWSQGITDSVLTTATG